MYLGRYLNWPNSKKNSFRRNCTLKNLRKLNKLLATLSKLLANSQKTFSKLSENFQQILRKLSRS